MPVVVYPYERFDEPLELRVDSLKVDFKAPDEDLISPALELVSLYRLEDPSWKTIMLKMTAIVPEGTVPAFDEDDQATVTAVAYCASTNARQAIILGQNGDKDQWRGDLALDRDAFQGKVELYAVATAEVDGRKNRLLGSTGTWKVYFDEPAIPPIEGMLPVKWLDFSEATAVPDFARSEPFYVALSETPPAVYLNMGFEKLPDLLTEEEQRPASERALRDAEYRRIATTAWSEMFAAAMASVAEDDEPDEVEWPESDWQRTALEAVLPRMYPGNPDDALEKAHDALRGEDHRDLQTRLQVAISEQIDAPKTLKQNLSQIV